MRTSILELFTIGIGPSSSHTVGPMRAARGFAQRLTAGGYLPMCTRITVTLFGSLAATAHGHGTRKAILLGLAGHAVEDIDIESIPGILSDIQLNQSLTIGGTKAIPFRLEHDLIMKAREQLEFHPNGMRFQAFGEDETILLDDTAFSIGGGFVVTEAEAEADRFDSPSEDPPFPFKSGETLLAHTKAQNCSIADIIDANEASFRPTDETEAMLDRIWAVMQACVDRGCHLEGTMPGLKVPRRAPTIYRQLKEHSTAAFADPLAAMDWVNMWALAVNEENATGGRVVTAPTNGAAGIIPAVLHYVDRILRLSDPAQIRIFLKTAGAIGLLFKENASISGAEVGCQGEVGAACSMAAAGLAAVMGGTPDQVENAAEIGMEHNLGLTCDPVGGLVQVPCIERNAMGAIKAINAARLALKGDGEHFVSLDKVIRTMRITGRDMKTQYKETARGGLAAELKIAQTVVDC